MENAKIKWMGRAIYENYASTSDKRAQIGRREFIEVWGKSPLDQTTCVLRMSMELSRSMCSVRRVAFAEQVMYTPPGSRDVVLFGIIRWLEKPPLFTVEAQPSAGVFSFPRLCARVWLPQS